MRGLRIIWWVEFLDDYYVAQSDHEFRTDRGFDKVCHGCIADPGLADFVERSGFVPGQCAFCSHPDRQGIQLRSLFEYMSGCIADEWEDPTRFVGWDGGWDSNIRIIDSSELLELLHEPLGDGTLRDTFIEAFQHGWCPHDPYRLSHSEKLTLSWARFAQLVKQRHRYLFLNQRTDDGELVAPAQMLEAVAQAIHNSDRVIHLVDAGMPIYRARAHQHTEYLETASTLGSPPHHLAKANRMSPAGIPMFYAADNAETAVIEIAPQRGQAITTARWSTTRDLWCLDFTLADPVPGLFDMIGRVYRTWRRFLAPFAELLSQPLDQSISEIEYVPTQIVTEYVRDALRSTTGAPIEAIAYRSSQDASLRCWVFFAEPHQCTDDDPTDDHLLMIDRTTVRRLEPHDADPSPDSGV